MEKVKLEELKNILLASKEIACKRFIGFVTSEHFDIFNTKYELEKSKEEYFYLTDILDKKMFVSKTFLLETLLTKEADMILNNEIYEHGYPEARLIPSDFYEKCQEDFVQNTIQEIGEEIENLLNEYF